MNSKRKSREFIGEINEDFYTEASPFEEISDTDWNSMRKIFEEAREQMYEQYFGIPRKTVYTIALEEAKQNLIDFTKKHQCIFPQAIKEAQYQVLKTYNMKYSDPEIRKGLNDQRKADIVELLVVSYIEQAALILKAEFEGVQ